MKKLLLLLAITSSTYANYTIKLPLETTSGGHLPENSINLGNENIDPEISDPENWIDASPLYTNWLDTNILYNCSGWTPTGASKTTSETFNQTSNNCSTDQTRSKQDREQETTTLEYRNKGTPVIENNTLNNQTANRSYTVTLGSWNNDGELYDCTNWNPDPSTINNGVSFVQTATDCKQNQIRNRIENYIDHKTNNVVQVLNNNEFNILFNQTSTRNTTGTKVIAKECRPYSSSNNWTAVYFFAPHASNSMIILKWDNISVGSTNNMSATEYSANGYKYTIGEYYNEGDDAMSYGYYSGICRE